MTYKEFIWDYRTDRRRIKAFIPIDEVHGEPTQYEIGTLNSFTNEEIFIIRFSQMIDFKVDDEYLEHNDDGLRECSLDQIEWLED